MRSENKKSADFKHIRLRHVTWLWCVVGLLSAINLWGWFWSCQTIEQEERRKAIQEAQVANSAFAEQMAQVMDLADTVLRAVRTHYIDTRSVESTERFITDLDLQHLVLENVYLVDASGHLVITHNPVTVGRSVVDRDYFAFHKAQAQDDLFIAPVELGRATRRYLFRVTRRISLPDGSFGGVVLVNLEPKALASYYRQITQADGSAASLLSIDDHRLRARIPEPNVDAWATPVASPLWQLLPGSDRGGYQAVSSIDGVQRNYVYQRLAGLPLVQVTGYSETSLQARVDQSLWPATVASVAFNLVVLVLAGVLTVIFRQRDAMHRLATTDVLTSVANRRHMEIRGEQEVVRAQRYDKPVALLMLDADRFKRVNDTWGHGMGDRVLQVLATLVTSQLRQPDVFGRMGGEEFLVLLPETDEDGALALAERVRQTVEACEEISTPSGEALRFTVSIGVSVKRTTSDTFDTLLDRADKALYRAKALGRNRVVAG